MTDTAKHIIFSGRVQGVGFRYTTHRIASHYGLTGFVRNLSDGTVEALLQGTDGNISACLNDVKDAFEGCLRDTKVIDQSVNPQHHDFRITY